MTTKVEFFEMLNKIDLPKRIDAKFIKNNFVLNDFRKNKSVINSMSYDIDDIFYQVEDKADTQRLVEIMTEFVAKLPKDSTVSFDDGLYESSASFIVYSPKGKKPETDTEVVQRLQGWVTEYRKEKREYEKYLELKAKFGV